MHTCKTWPLRQTTDALPSSCSHLWFQSLFIPYLVPLDQLGFGLFKSMLT